MKYKFMKEYDVQMKKFYISINLLTLVNYLTGYFYNFWMKFTKFLLLSSFSILDTLGVLVVNALFYICYIGIEFLSCICIWDIGRTW